MSEEYVSRKVAAEISGVPAQRLNEWRNAGVIPTNEEGILYNASFMQRVVSFAGEQKPRIWHAQLCMLEWRSTHQPEAWPEIAEFVAQLLSEQKIFTTPEIARIMGYSETAIMRWMRIGFLPSVKVVNRYKRIMPVHVCLRNDVIRVKSIMGSLTSYEVAARLGISATRTANLAQKGSIKGTSTPDGWRFDPKDVEAYMATRHYVGITTAEACALIGIPKGIFKGWVATGHIALTGEKKSRRRLCSPTDAARVKAQIETLNGDFAIWLPATIHDPTYALKVVARKLGVADHSVGVWAQENLLPFFDPTAPELPNHQNRMFVAEYVDGLVSFVLSHGVKTSRQVVSAFKEYALSHYIAAPPSE